MRSAGVFDPESYQRYRPFYPPAAFAGLAAGLEASGFHPPFFIVDAGCGTGHSAISLLRTGINARILGIDPDPLMLAAAESLRRSSGFPPESLALREASAEATGLDARSVDAILVASAFHWMSLAHAAAEFARVLRPSGRVRICEYQFPKAEGRAELNEWIRQRFNRDWRAPNQEPRGDLRELTRVFRDSGRWTLTGEARPPMRLSLDAGELSGLILSQSRVLHYERSLPEPARAEFRDDLRDRIECLLAGTRADFDFRLAWTEFRLSTAG